MARKTLTDKGVANLKAKDKLYMHPDIQLPGHFIRVNPGGSKSYVVIARNPSGKQIWTTIGNAAHIKIDVAREQAREVIVRIKGGQRVEGPKAFESVLDDWI